MVIDEERVKEFNSRLRHAKDEHTRLATEVAVGDKEIDRLCSELSNALGISITKDNCEQVCEELIKKINSELEAGEQILNNINKSESVDKGKVTGLGFEGI